MTAKETDILTSKTLLKKGVAIDRMLQSIIVDKSIKVQDLIVGDKNAVLIAARKSGFGADYETSIGCRTCGAQQDQSFDLDDVKVKEGRSDVQFTDEGTFFIDLPVSKVQAECKLMTGNDEQVIVRKAEKKKKLKLGESMLT